MSIRSTPGRWSGPVIVGILISALLAPFAWAQCNYTVLEPHKLTATTTAPEYFSIDQPGGGWTAIALQSASGEDWDLFMNGTTAPYPGCVDDPLAASSEGTGVVDFIVGDFTHNVPGTYYPMAKQFLGSGSGTIVHSRDNRTLEVNGSVAFVDLGPLLSLDCWRVYLEAGHTYSIYFTIYPLSTIDARVFLFQNPGSGIYWASRAAAELEITGPTTYVAPASDWYCLVGVSDNFGTGTYVLSIRECAEPISLASGVAAFVDLRANYFELNQSSQSWAAVGFRHSDPGIGLWIYGDAYTGVLPHCYGDSLVHIDQSDGRVAVVAANFTPGGVPLGTYHGRAENDFLSGQGVIEWDGGAGSLPINGTPITVQTGPDDVVECWDIWLDETQNYAFHFAPPGDADIELLLFPDPGKPTWTRNAIAGFHTSGQYNPYTTGKFGLVAVNRNGEPGTYSVSVDQCIPLPTKFTEFVRVHSVSAPEQRFSFIQDRRGWAAVAVKGMADWDLFAFEHASGGDPDFCFSNPLAASSAAPAGGVDFVIGDFHRNSPAEYYASAELANGAGDATAVWEPYSRLLSVNDTPYGTSLAGDDFIDLYEVFLAAGNQYQFDLNHETGSGEPSLILFAPDGDTYWADRSFHEFEITSTTLYRPISTGYFGIAVINDSVDPAGYTVSVTSPGVSAGSGPIPAGPSIRSLIPNPTNGNLKIQFETAKPGAVEFEIVDVVGRRIARVNGQSDNAGTGEASWNGRTSRGEPAPAGVYFVRMYDGDHVSTVRKLVISH